MVLLTPGRYAVGRAPAHGGATRRRTVERMSTSPAPASPRARRDPPRSLAYDLRARDDDELVALLQEDPTISLLVLATAPGGSTPGPLVTFLLGHLGRRVRIPVTLVPGELTLDEIDALS